MALKTISSDQILDSSIPLKDRVYTIFRNRTASFRSKLHAPSLLPLSFFLILFQVLFSYLLSISSWSDITVFLLVVVETLILGHTFVYISLKLQEYHIDHIIFRYHFEMVYDQLEADPELHKLWNEVVEKYGNDKYQLKDYSLTND